jgi:hypothetical protein
MFHKRASDAFTLTRSLAQRCARDDSKQVHPGAGAINLNAHCTGQRSKFIINLNSMLTRFTHRSSPGVGTIAVLAYSNDASNVGLAAPLAMELQDHKPSQQYLLVHRHVEIYQNTQL